MRGVNFLWLPEGGGQGGRGGQGESLLADGGSVAALEGELLKGVQSGYVLTGTVLKKSSVIVTFIVPFRKVYHVIISVAVCR